MKTLARGAAFGAVLLVATTGAFVAGRAAAARPGPSPAPDHPAAAAPASPGPDLPPSEPEPALSLPDFRGVAKKVVPAVVTVRSQKTVRVDPRSSPGGDEFFEQFFGGRQRAPREERYVQRGLGSGVVVSGDGYIITNNHVVEGVDKVEVVLADGRTVGARVLGTDPPTDIAVIKIDGSSLLTVPFGDSDRLEVGEWVLAVGNPFSERLGHTVTAGIVSAKGRSNLRLADYEDFIQTDAAINPGNSGGALVNTRGQLVGINSAIVTGSGGSQGIGFAIPINMARNVMDQLIKNGKVVRGWVGMTIQDLTPELAEGLGLPGKEGALVSAVQPGAPAAEAGLKRGDAITAVDAQGVKNNSDLRNRVAATAPGTKVRLGAYRDGEARTFTVTLGELPAPGGKAPAGGHPPDEPALGFTVRSLSREIAEQLGLEGESGVIVSEVESGGPAEEAGLQEGDLIKEINRRAISGLNDYRSALAGAKRGHPVLLLIRRGDATTYVSIKP
ncbi:MAG: DegQ family serine endoprotease [Acidobacteria bacterium]|nr:DegQ family serine endoprotease [Acidobacteriota bacterium]